MKLKTLHRKKRKYFLFILLLCMTGMTKMYAYDFSAVCETGQTLYYNITDSTNHYVELTCPGEANYSNCWAGFDKPTGDIVLPENVQYEGVTYTITSIGDYTFYNCRGITGNLIIPNTVVSIGERAFEYCSGFTGSLSIPNSVTSIGNYAFYSCSGFTGSLTIPNSVTSIGNYAFYSCSGFTGSLTIPNSVTSIGDNPFSGCIGLEQLLVASGNTIYDSRDNCNAIINTSTNTLISGCKNTVIPNSVISIGYGAFDGCSSFMGTLTIPNSVTIIDTLAFSFCSGLTGDLTIPNSVTSIGVGAFQWCNGFTGDLTIPNSVITMGDYAFNGCSGFTGSLTIGNSVTKIGEYAFFNCTGFTGSLIIPNSVIEIDTLAFAQCTGFTGDLIIGDSVTSIGGYAFYRCSGFTGNLTIGNSVTTIGERAFDGCSSFTGLTLGNSVTEIRNYAFNNCSGFTGGLIMGNSVTEIGKNAFYNCSGFTGVYYTGSIEQWCNISFGISAGNPLCYAHDLYINNVLVTNLVIPESVTEVKTCAFFGATCLTSLTIPNSVTTIGDRAFLSCSGLTGSLTIPNSVTSIGGMAFFNCNGFTSMNSLAVTPPSLGTSAFHNAVFDIPVTVPCGAIEAYQNASGWSQFTNYLEDCSLHITATASPAEGGIVTGAGTFEEGDTCTLIATPAQGYFFHNWTQNGNVVSANPTFSFIVTESANYTANFMLNLPELHVTGITHSTFVGGQPVTINWTVQNDGSAATPNGALWHDRVWLSVESRVAADDNNPILLGTFDNLSALAPGEYYTQTQTFTLPLELSGNYYLFVLTDAYDCHTIYWDSTGVQLPYSPPPYIGCLSHHCYSGCPNYADNRIYELSEFEHGDAPGGFYNDNFFYTLVDIAVPPLPDLQVTSVVAPEDLFGIFNPYTEARITATIRNSGVNPIINGHWKDELYMSLDPEGSSAMLIGIHAHSGSLGVGESYQVNEWNSGWIVAPSGRDRPQEVIFGGFMLSGDVYFFVQTDGYDDVYERLENNNIGVSNAMHAYLGATGDLEPSDLNVPDTVSTGEVFSYSYRVYNNGAGEPYGNNRGSIYYFVDNWWDKIYLCQNADTLDDSAILLKMIHHFGGLEHGTYYSVSESIVLPQEVTSGTYYLYVFTDVGNIVYEHHNEDNNLARSNAISVVRPDLQVVQISAPEQITAGYPLNISYSLANSGEGSIINRMITDRICISASGNMTDTVGLASIRRDVYLPSEHSLTVICNDLAPSNLTGGTYHLIVVTDCGHDINESNEGNNIGSLYPINVTYPPMPDLEPVSLALPEIIQAGGTIPVQFDVTNVGDLDLLNSNCTFDIYAVWNDHKILCPMQSQTLPLGNYVSIGINETLHFVRTIMVPPTVTSACSTFELIVNKGSLVPESDTTNNVFTATASVLDCPLPDLVVANISANTMQSGVENQISFTVNNIGTADFEGHFNTTVYIRSASDTILCPLILQVSPSANNYSIPIGGALAFTQKVLIPPMANASCNILEVIVDEETFVLESNDDNNATTVVASIINYPFDLKTTVLQVPESVWAGETASLTWTVENIGTCPSESIPLYVKKNGTYTLVQGEILPQPWTDKVYVSEDAVLSDDDIELCSVARSTVLQPNGTYAVEQSVRMPYTHLDAQYLLCVSDATHVTYDSDTLNNVKSIPIEVHLGVLPDLRITSLYVHETVTCDRAYWVHYTVINEGERVTQKENWTDAFYIGEAMTTIGALQLGTKIHHGALDVGESYTDSIEIIIPNGLEGDYFLMGFTDRTEQIYEHDNENDNLLSIPVTVYALDPCDLIAMQPEFPTAVASGGDMAVSWRLNNIGPNPAIGRIRNAIYLSTDATWSSDDMMLGYADTDINIAVNGHQLCHLSGSITGLDEGRYYVIVKANILNALNETSYENNICSSIFPTEITFPTLAIGETIHRTIEPKRYNYYKIEVGPEYEGQTLLCRMESHEHNLSVANEIYLSYESVPTPMDFDYGVFAPYSYEQEIIIPSLEQGTYYLMAQGVAFHEVDSYIIMVSGSKYIDTVSAQNITISTSIVNFEILSINDNHGSNTGSFTTKVTGAKFEEVMDIRLVQGDNYQPAQKTFFSNSTETYVTFNLTDLPLGTYSMEAELPGGVITVKENAFTIEEGLPAELHINIIKPSSVRRGNTFPVTIEYCNVGATDLNVEGLVVMSRNGHPVGFTSEELQTGQTTVGFYTSEENGNPGIMRPGYNGAKAILVKATNVNDVNLVVYAIRRQN